MITEFQKIYDRDEKFEEEHSCFLGNTYGAILGPIDGSTRYVWTCSIYDAELISANIAIDDFVGKNPENVKIQYLYDGEGVEATFTVSGVEFCVQPTWAALKIRPNESISDMAERLEIDEENFLV